VPLYFYPTQKIFSQKKFPHSVAIPTLFLPSLQDLLLFLSQGLYKDNKENFSKSLSVRGLALFFGAEIHTAVTISAPFVTI
jgi:hypothetical protein